MEEFQTAGHLRKQSHAASVLDPHESRPDGIPLKSPSVRAVKEMHSSSASPTAASWLIAGFGGLFLMLLAGSADSDFSIHNCAKRFHAMAKSATLTCAAFNCWNKVRSGVYQSSVILRDYLLRRRPFSPPTEEAVKWSDIRSKTDRAPRTKRRLQAAARRSPALSKVTQRAQRLLEASRIGDYSRAHPGTNPYSSY